MDARPLPLVTPDEVIDRLKGAWPEVAARSSPVLVAFDADGTLWSGDVGETMFAALAGRGGVRPAARDALLREARAHGLPVDDAATPTEVAEALHAAYERGVGGGALPHFPEREAFSMHGWVFAGWSIDEAAAFAREVLASFGLDRRLRTWVQPILQTARSLGAEVVVVSCSPRSIVEEAVAPLGIASTSVIALTPAVEDGRMLPRIEGVVPYAEGKVAALRASRPGATLLAAFGDTGYDAAMMKGATIRVAIDPKRSLLQRAADLPELCELVPAGSSASIPHEGGG